ncbi:hypothetical protein [Empedobacter falsenii]|uniref:hypothetical protein n=1 Tax=Empedobacter falsenii TaxID=343874 RepID=UPI001C8D2DA4|nr:hypothetical protein [Empedobacter falsenii]MBY0067050.1 hypothetical protein [Empedobacter falsenii]
MNSNSEKLAQKLREIDRKQKSIIFIEYLLKIMNKSDFEILDFNFSDSFIENSEQYPKNKYERNLFKQIDLENKLEVQNSIKSYFIEINEVYISSYNYNFGLVKMSKEIILNNWENLLNFDEDEVMIYNPKNGKFLTIELTEELMINQEEKGIIKFYELTFSEK